MVLVLGFRVDDLKSLKRLHKKFPEIGMCVSKDNDDYYFGVLFNEYEETMEIELKELKKEIEKLEMKGPASVSYRNKKWKPYLFILNEEDADWMFEEDSIFEDDSEDYYDRDDVER